MATNAGEVEVTVKAHIEKTPVHYQSFKALLTAIPKRIIGLVSKAISIKVVMFGIGVVLYLKTDRFDQWALIVLASVVIFGREALDVVKAFMGRK